MSAELQVSREDAILRLTLNRPEKKNALSSAMTRALADEIENGGNDTRVRAILLAAKGDVFCAGMDLTEASGENAVVATDVHERLFTAGSRLRKPLIAAVSGHVLGGGIGLIANAHVVLAAQGCSFGLTEIRVGMWPFVIWRAVTAAIGERRALALALTGRIFSVHEALQWGVVHEVTPAFELEDRAWATALHLAHSSSEAIALGLEFVFRSRSAGGTEAGSLALSFREKAFRSDDFREGVAAFREKRKPRWAE